MEQFTLYCPHCQQEMLVPESAIGRRGLCPGCGAEVPIAREGLVPYQPPRPQTPRTGLLRGKAAERAQAERTEAARKFAEAVDLYNQRLYAQALALLDDLRAAYPGSEEVDAARQQCLSALHDRAAFTRSYEGRPVDETRLTPDLVNSIVLDKLLHSPSEEVQLKAAELAARLLGMEPRPKPAAPLIVPEPSANGHASKPRAAKPRKATPRKRAAAARDEFFPE